MGLGIPAGFMSQYDKENVMRYYRCCCAHGSRAATVVTRCPNRADTLAKPHRRAAAYEPLAGRAEGSCRECPSREPCFGPLAEWFHDPK